MASETETRPTAWRPWALLWPALLWLAATILKETPSFWRNEGNYPLQLRAFVLDFYYPYLMVLFVGTGWTLWRQLVLGLRPARAALIGWILLAFVLGSGAALLIGNNLVNLLEGRPLHQHPFDR